MGNMKYNVGDRVRIKSLDWYNENKDELGNVGYFSSRMKQFCGQIVIVSKVTPPFYCMENINIFLWSDEMIEGLVEEETNQEDVGTKIESVGFMQMGKTVSVIFNNENYEDEVELQLGDYEIAVRNGKTYAVRKKPKYPTTYKECCEILSIPSYFTLKYSTYKHEYHEYTTSKKLRSLEDELNCHFV